MRLGAIERRDGGVRPRDRRRTTCAATVSASCALLLVLAGCDASGTPSDKRAASPGQRPPAGKADTSEGGPDSGDFNGDGHDDYATVVHSATKDRERSKDTLLVVYGSKKGLNRSWTTRADGGFQQLLRTDLNGDGFTDLVGARPRGAAERDRGRARALFGGPRGLSRPRALDVPAGFRPQAAGDFDGDGKTDLFDTGSGGRGDADGGPSARRSGTPARIVHGPVGTADGRPHEHARTSVPPDMSQHGYAAPESAAAGDFDADGRTDLVLTYGYDAEQDDSAPAGLSRIAYYRGTADGPARDRGVEDMLRRQSAGGPDGPSAPAVGDADGDGIDDLLMPLALPVSYAERKAGRGGGVGILHGARSGLGTGKRAVRITEGRGAGFGASPAVGDVNGDGHPDIVANTPGFRRHDGLVTLLPGGPDGPSARGAQEIDVRSKGLPGTPNPHHWNAFAVQPPLLDTDGDGCDDAVVFLPLHNGREGAFLEIPGSEKGFAPSRARQFTPAEAGVPLRLR
ncbi:FG-GAP and VCBS repeat-containing protein [Streptomyces albus]|uniref:FG-GAP and VCBS repeat-containing protein n=1 Tax=Streptomyces sp. PHES57 TaxID=2872626 RepID=UPI001CEC5E31|nr:FG-GAP and VCBS repeat-containing protein [Streptomyces sp. PHES57]